MISKNKFDLSKQIVSFIAKNNKPVCFDVIFHYLRKNNKINKLDLNLILNQLIKNKQIVQPRRNYYILTYSQIEIDASQIFQGKININVSLNGFITLLDQTEAQYFVHKSNLNGAIDGDTVSFGVLKIAHDENKKLIDARVIKILKREQKKYVGTYQDHQITCDDPKIYLPLILEEKHELQDKTKFLFSIAKFTSEIISIKVEKILGKKDDVGMDILSLIYQHDVDPIFPEDVKQNCAAICQKPKLLLKYYHDLSQLNFVTIDPQDSKDYDDAVCVEKNELDQWILYVAIADVSSYIEINSPLDIFAAKRNCSIYLPDRVVPMLPFAICDDLCSLLPNKNRYTIVCKMIYDDHGCCLGSEIFPSVIKSKCRLCYQEVNDFYDGKNKLEKLNDHCRQMLLNAKQLGLILKQKRIDNGYFNFEFPEPKFQLDQKGWPIAINFIAHGLAQEMIENFMIAANKNVTEFANAHQLPFIYRIHEKPTLEKVNDFLMYAKNLDFAPIEHEDSIKTIASAINRKKDSQYYKIICLLLLRMMSKAKYDTTNIGHYGLSLNNYTHFTSPIRRYTDLLVHRILWMFVFAKNEFQQTQRNELIQQLKRFCQIANSQEENNVDLERSADNLKITQFMLDKVGKTYHATITGIRRTGVFVAVDENFCINGFVRVASMRDGFYIYNELNNTFLNQQTNSLLFVGKKITVKCEDVNVQISQINFSLINSK